MRRSSGYAAAVALLCGSALCGCKLDPLSQHLDSGSQDTGSTTDTLFWHEVGTLPDASTGKCPGAPFSEKVAPGGRATAIAVDPQSGVVHVLHHVSKPDEDAVYSFKDSSGWHTETIMSEGLVGVHNSIGVAPDGTVHAVFADLTRGTLVHGIKAPSASSWSLALIDGTGGRPNGLALDDSGRLHLVASDKAGHATIYLRYEQGAWQQPVVLESELPSLAEWPSIAVSGDRLHVVCADKAGQVVYRSGTTAGVFDPRKVLDSGLEDPSAVVAVDDEGDVHVIYNNELQETLRYVGQSGGSGTFDASLKLADINTVAASNFGLFADLVILQGEPAVVYSDDKHLLSVKRHDGIWLNPEVVGFCCGSQISAAVGPKGELHIAHWDTSGSEELRYTKVCPDGS